MFWVMHSLWVPGIPDKNFGQYRPNISMLAHPQDYGKPGDQKRCKGQKINTAQGLSHSKCLINAYWIHGYGSLLIGLIDTDLKM